MAGRVATRAARGQRTEKAAETGHAVWGPG